MQNIFFSPRFSTDSRALQNAAAALGWNCLRLHKWEVPEKPEGSITVYGETLFARFIAENLKLELQDPPHHWLTTLPEEILRRKIELTNVDEARKITKPAFIKPVDDKTFKAQVFNSGAEIPTHLDDNEPVLVSEPVKWEVEYRFFLLNGKVLTGSVYARNGELNDEHGSEEDFEMAKGIAEKYAVGLPVGVVIDTGKIKDLGWSIVEANPAWGSGIYDCDPQQVLKVVAAACK